VDAPRPSDDAAFPGAWSTTLPNLIVIGAQKCGTSGLHSWLDAHPQIAMSKPKELNFFIEARNWHRGLDWYARHFDPRVEVRGESSPNYTTYPRHPGVPERMHSVVPNAKLVFLIRDPLERIAAHWVHNYAKRREKGDLLTTLAYPRTSYVVRSQYHMQLEQFLSFYPLERILILQQSELRRDRHATLRRVFEFVGVDSEFEDREFDRERHATAGKRRASRVGAKIQRLGRTEYGQRLPKRFWNALDIPVRLRRPIARPDVRHALPPETLRLLREDAERLRELTGRDFAHWSIWDA
jgi:hypothetical protein